MPLPCWALLKEVGGMRSEASSRCLGLNKGVSHGPQFVGTCMKTEGYGFVNFKISNSTISTVFHQPLEEGYGFLVTDWRPAFWESVAEGSPLGDQVFISTYTYIVCIYIYIYIYIQRERERQCVYIYIYIAVW